MKRLHLQNVQRHDARELASGYSKSIRALEVVSIFSFAGILIAHGYRLFEPTLENPWLMLAAFAGGFLFADFASGFVHWLADTWGSTDMPLIGKTLLRPFREHHVDQKAITRHDFIETNGNNCLICVPAGSAALLVPLESAWLFFGVAGLVWSMLWVMATNQFHKWAHLDEAGPVVAFLQRWHLILPPAHHAIHHSTPYTSHYSITTGWMNRPLAAIRFYRALEWGVTRVTGAIPRADDIGRSAALAVHNAEVAETVDTFSRHAPEARLPLGEP